MTKRRKRLLAVLAALALLVIALVPFPATVDDAVKNRVVPHAVSAVVHNHRVPSDEGYSQLVDCGHVKDEGRLYFENKLGIPDSLFLEQGLKPIPADERPDVDGGDVIIGFSAEDGKGNPTKHIQFYYVFGSLGAQGYEIRVYRSLLLWHFVYVWRWVS